MMHKLTAISGVILCAGLVGCGSPQNVQELTQKTIEYRCGPGGDTPLSVQYTFQGDEPLAAKVIYQNQAVDLTRATTNNADMVGNTFRGNGYSWTTEKFTAENVESANGNMLAQETSQVVGGQNAAVGNILVRDCKVDS